MRLYILVFFREHNILEGSLLCNENQNMIQFLKNSVKFYEQPQSEYIIFISLHRQFLNVFDVFSSSGSGRCDFFEDCLNLLCSSAWKLLLALILKLLFTSENFHEAIYEESRIECSYCSCTQDLTTVCKIACPKIKFKAKNWMVHKNQ